MRRRSRELSRSTGQTFQLGWKPWMRTWRQRMRLLHALPALQRGESGGRREVNLTQFFVLRPGFTSASVREIDDHFSTCMTGLRLLQCIQSLFERINMLENQSDPSFGNV